MEGESFGVMVADVVRLLQERFRVLKTAPVGELTHLLSICICLVYHSYGGTWHSDLQELWSVDEGANEHDK